MKIIPGKGFFRFSHAKKQSVIFNMCNYIYFYKSNDHLTRHIICFRLVSTQREKKKKTVCYCSVYWVAHSALRYTAAVTLSLNSGLSVSDVDECVGAFYSCLEKRRGPRPAANTSGAGALIRRPTKKHALCTLLQRDTDAMRRKTLLLY